MSLLGSHAHSAHVPNLTRSSRQEDVGHAARLARVATLLATASLLSPVFGCSSAETPATSDGTSEDDLVGGKPDARWPALGYLSHGKDLASAATARVACGATLVSPNVVVTAAHCVQSAPNDRWVFGVGELGSKAPYEVVSVRVHPKFHEAPTSAVDVRYFLKNFDLATVVLARPVTGVTPATLPSEAARMGCSYRAIGYRADATSRGRRRGADACVGVRVDLGGDPIFEVHPAGASALCNGDGDEGSPVVTAPSDAPDAAPVLHGIYVGSVTQGLTDCRRGTQFLNGYEAMFGFKSFVEEGISAGKTRL